jgi:hypothetical protein
VSNLIKINKTIKYLAALGTVLSVSPLSVFAQEDPINIKVPGAQPIYDLTPSKLVSGAISIILGVSGIVAFFVLLIGGIQWILAGGDKEGTEKARKKITAALIGLAIVFSAYALIFILKALFGIDLFQFTLKNIGSYNN